MPPLFGVMSALVLAFVLGLGMAYTHSVKLKGVMDDFKSIIDRVIAGVIIPRRECIQTLARKKRNK